MEAVIFLVPQVRGSRLRKKQLDFMICKLYLNQAVSEERRKKKKRQLPDVPGLWRGTGRI